MMNMTVATVKSLLNSGSKKKTIDPRDFELYQDVLRNYEAIGPDRFSSIDQDSAARLKEKLNPVTSKDY